MKNIKDVGSTAVLMRAWTAPAVQMHLFPASRARKAQRPEAEGSYALGGDYN